MGFSKLPFLPSFFRFSLPFVFALHLLPSERMYEQSGGVVGGVVGCCFLLLCFLLCLNPTTSFCFFIFHISHSLVNFLFCLIVFVPTIIFLGLCLDIKMLPRFYIKAL